MTTAIKAITTDMTNVTTLGAERSIICPPMRALNPGLRASLASPAKYSEYHWSRCHQPHEHREDAAVPLAPEPE